jgi:hypothetical protein
VKLYPLLFEVLESRETANLQVCRKIMAHLLKQKIAPVPFSCSINEARAVLASLRARGTPPAIWLINSYWAEEMLPDLDLMIGTTPVVLFKRDLLGAGLSTQAPAVGAPDKISAIMGKMTPRLTVLWGFGTGNADAVAERAAGAVAKYLADGDFRHVEEVAPGHNSVLKAMSSANQNLDAFRAQFDALPKGGASSSTAAAVRAGASSGNAPAVVGATATGAAPAARAPDSRPASRPVPVRRGITGTLEQLGLSTLLMMMEMEKKTGELLINKDNAQIVITIKAGRILQAHGRGAGIPPESAEGEECIFFALSWTSGIFEFQIKSIACEDTIQASTTSLLMEGARRMDEGSADAGDGAGILG